MRQHQPLIWGTVLVVAVLVAMSSTNVLLLVILVATLLAISALDNGPRRASMTMALGLSLCASLIWLGYTLLVPADRGDTILVQLPSLEVGPGITLGGPLSVTGMLDGLAHALSAVAVILALGLAGQMVPPRGWLALAHSSLGPLAPAVAWGCCLGASAPAALRTLPARPALGLRTWLTGAVRTAETISPRLRAAPGVFQDVRVLLAGSMAGITVAYWYLDSHLAGWGLEAADGLALVALTIVGIGLALPGSPAELRRWHTADVILALPVIHLAAVWFLRPLLLPAHTVHPPHPLSWELPLWLVLALVLVPVAMALSSTRHEEAVQHA